MNDEKTLEEDKQTILNCDHDFYLREDSESVAKESLFCKKCGNHFIVIVNTYREELFNPDKTYLSPKCQNCGFQTTVDGFVSDCWLQLIVDDKSIWVCPDCIAKKANAN